MEISEVISEAEVVTEVVEATSEVVVIEEVVAEVTSVAVVTFAVAVVEAAVVLRTMARLSSGLPSSLFAAHQTNLMPWL